MLLGKLVAVMFGNGLTGKEVIRVDKGVIRAGESL